MRPMLRHEVCIENDPAMRLDLAELSTYFLFAEGASDPRPIEALETVPVKASLGVVQKFEIFRHRHEVLAFFKVLAHGEITQDFGGHIRLQGSLYLGLKAFARFREVRVRRRYIKE